MSNVKSNKKKGDKLIIIDKTGNLGWTQLSHYWKSHPSLCSTGTFYTLKRLHEYPKVLKKKTPDSGENPTLNSQWHWD